MFDKTKILKEFERNFYFLNLEEGMKKHLINTMDKQFKRLLKNNKSTTVSPETASDSFVYAHQRNTNTHFRPATRTTSCISQREADEVVREGQSFLAKSEKTTLTTIFEQNGFSIPQKIDYLMGRTLKRLPYDAQKASVSLVDWQEFITDLKNVAGLITEEKTADHLFSNGPQF